MKLIQEIKLSKPSSPKAWINSGLLNPNNLLILEKAYQFNLIGLPRLKFLAKEIRGAFSNKSKTFLTHIFF